MLDARILCRRSSLMLALGCSRVGGSPCRCMQGCLELLPLYSASVCPRHSPPAMSGKAPGNSRSTALFRLLLFPPLALDRPRDLLVFFRHLGEAVPSQILRPSSMPLRHRLGIILAQLLGIVLDRHVLPHCSVGPKTGRQVSSLAAVVPD